MRSFLAALMLLGCGGGTATAEVEEPVAVTSIAGTEAPAPEEPPAEEEEPEEAPPSPPRALEARADESVIMELQSSVGGSGIFGTATTAGSGGSFAWTVARRDPDGSSRTYDLTVAQDRLDAVIGAHRCTQGQVSRSMNVRLRGGGMFRIATERRGIVCRSDQGDLTAEAECTTVDDSTGSGATSSAAPTARPTDSATLRVPTDAGDVVLELTCRAAP